MGERLASWGRSCSTPLSVSWGVEADGRPTGQLFSKGVASPGTTMSVAPGLVGHRVSGHEGPVGAGSFPITPRICMLLSLVLLTAVAVVVAVALVMAAADA